VTLLDRIGQAWAALAGRGGARADAFGPTGGPVFGDAWLSRRGPAPARLVESFKQVVYACATLNAGGVARVPLRLYATTGAGQARPRAFAGPVRVGRRGRLERLARLPYLARQMAAAESVDEITAHPLLDALDRPNPHFDRPGLLAYLVLCLDVVGTAYVRPEGAAGLPPERLWPLQAHLVKPVAGASAAPESYTYLGETIPAAGLVRFRHLSLREPYGSGYAPAAAAAGYAGLEDKWVSIQDQILGRGPAPQAMVGPSDPKQPFGDEARRRIEALFRSRQAGAAAGGVLVVDDAYTYTPLSYRPTDLSGLEIGRYNLERTANCFGVPLPFLTGETNLANLQAAELQHGRHAVEPRCVLLAGALTLWARRFDPRLFFAFDPAVAEDEERESKVADTRLKNGSLTINEVRLEGGYEPVPWGEEPWLAATLRQPSEERPEPKPAAPPPGPAPESEPEPEPGPADDQADAEKALLGAAASILRTLEGRLARGTTPTDTDPAGPRRGLGRAGRAAADAGAAKGGGGEHLWVAGWRADQADPAAVVQGAAGGDPGDDPDDRGGPEE
jgi:phage portal protein BeeE